MSLYLLDTNISSYIIKGNFPVVRERLCQVPMSEISISVVTQAELLYGVAKRGNPTALTKRVNEFLIRVNVLAWTAGVAEVYADLRVACERAGVTLSPLDLFIAAHAKAVGAVLVTSDQAFRLIPGEIKLEDWTRFE